MMSSKTVKKKQVVTAHGTCEGYLLYYFSRKLKDGDVSTTMAVTMDTLQHEPSQNHCAKNEMLAVRLQDGQAPLHHDDFFNKFLYQLL